MDKCIVIEGSFKEANRLALLISLGESDLKYTLLDAIELHVEDIINAIKTTRYKQRAFVVKNVSRETDLAELLKVCCGNIPLIVACNFSIDSQLLNIFNRNKLDFQLITINNIEHEKANVSTGTLQFRL